MIKNIVFDMGNVVLAFNPYLFVERLNISADDKELLIEKIYRSKEWTYLDNGSRTEAEVIEILKDRIPERLHFELDYLVAHWDEPIVEIEGMYELIGELKKKGYGIYLLSNASSRQHIYWKGVRAAELFQDTLISADVRLVKPDHRIYRLMLDKFSINPAETVFIDDSIANINAAVEMGIAGFHFMGDTAELREYFVKQNIL